MYAAGMGGRTLDDFEHERGALDAAHTQNEAGRDAFVALAHTALFAASVSFVGDVAPITEAIWRPALIAGWTADVVGLLALTFSFGAARRAIDARRKALNDPEPPSDRISEWLNGIALWSFPVALLCLFSFVTANVVNADDRKIESSAAAQIHSEGSDPSAACAFARRPAEAVDGSHPCTPLTVAPSATASSSKEVRARDAI
jgi:hypothetical protein